MNGLEVLWHLFSTFDSGFMFIVFLGVIALVASYFSDKYIANEETKHHVDDDQYR
jgi:hypothetical protein